MQCTSPLTGWRAVEGGFTTSLNRAYADRPLTVRCNKCMGCRLHRAYVWAIRCSHEASLYDNNIFVTMTYDDEHLPFGNTLDRKHVQDFLKRLRKTNKNLRIFYCGEYGGRTDRPHYHALIFNYRPKDEEHFTTRANGKVYRSDILDKTWGHGLCQYADVNFQTAAYTAGYITKKVGGDIAEEHYQWICEETGEIHQRVPEFQGQSMKPGLGERWIKKYIEDVYPRDLIVLDGKKCKPPRFYDQICERERPDLWKQTLKRRQEVLPTLTTTETQDGQKAATNTKDPSEYFGTGRQQYARNKIIVSRQSLREPDK